MSGTSSWFPWSSSSIAKQAEDAAARKQEEETLHRKRIATILRYIASMHQALRAADGSSGHCFVRNCRDPALASDFFQYERSSSADEDVAQETGAWVLFSTDDFRKLIAAEAAEGGSSSLWPSPPFSFYASSSTSSSRASAASAGGSSPSVFSKPQRPQQRGQGVWLRLTRLGPNSVEQKPDMEHPVVERYLHGWLKECAPKGVTCVQDLLTIHRLDRAPSVPSTVSARNQRLIRSFLQRYKRYLRMKLYQKTLEPLYNRLFEWIQQQNDNNEELVWGLGHCKFLAPNGQLINGPLLEVLVEVELAPDGALLVRPREHTGVALNREVIAALMQNDPSCQHAALSQLHRTVGDLESTQFAPGQPATYVPLLKRISVELTSNGAFQPSSATPSAAGKKRSPTALTEKMVITEAWCLYSRSKPSSVWARDANLLADSIPERNVEIPTAAWSISHGPSKLEQILDEQIKQNSDKKRDESKSSGGISRGISGWLANNFVAQDSTEEDDEKKDEEPNAFVKPIFPLATSDSQHRIADLLMRQNYPAVLCEGPPGTGKTHTIANIISAYLCNGKRVLVTSKKAQALCVLRNRLPQTVQELCVDVTQSETQGMRQLQQTVERLALRVSVANVEIEKEKCFLLQQSIEKLEQQVEEMNQNLTTESCNIRELLQQAEGRKLAEKSSHLIQNAPWIMKMLPSWDIETVESICRRLQQLQLEKSDPICTVSGFESPPPKALISLALAKSGSALSSLVNATRNAVATLPLVGSIMDVQLQRIHEELENLRLNGRSPVTSHDWKIVSEALKRDAAIFTFEEEVWIPYVKNKGWPERSFREHGAMQEMIEVFETAVEVKRLQNTLSVKEKTEDIAKCRELDELRHRLTEQIRHHSQELVDAAVITQLSNNFTPDAQSALIRFSQIAGAAKFSKSSKPSKMTQRQRRRRQEYLDAFDKCSRFIPCWICTTNQICDYLPAECLFDLVIIDEASQSDVTVLPTLMRGKQWLIVGDGKQVSPTESFVSEDDIDGLRAALPPSPLEDALLPGRSFFDMAAQAFPRGRVVLSEHFRCAPEIIEFSNRQFYDGRLVPLRLPTKLERFVPSLIDVKVPGGAKSGKVNEKEAMKIVEMIMEIMDTTDLERPRSIGVISLIGDKQSRLIRGRLLDACGPEKMARHDVLIGDPPTFQGAERDVVFLSCVCSPGSCPTQNQQFHFQRANVALSRARDRCVLVRSIDISNIPSLDDAKVPILEFFAGASVQDPDTTMDVSNPTNRHKKRLGTTLLKHLLSERNYEWRCMSSIWPDALCIEHQSTDTRAAILIDCEETTIQEWSAGFAQQKAIERVGWKCLRLDALSLISDFSSAMDCVTKFLSSVGIDEPQTQAGREDDFGPETNSNVDMQDEGAREKESLVENRDVIEIVDNDEAVAISCEEGEIGSKEDSKPAAVNTIRPDESRSLDFGRDECIDASKFGEVVNLDFLLQRKNSDDDANDLDPDDDEVFDNEDMQSSTPRNSPPRTKKLRRSSSSQGKIELTRKRTTPEHDDGLSEDDVDNTSNPDEMEDVNAGIMENSGGEASQTSKSKKRRRLDKYSRDGRWYPSNANNTNGSDTGEWYDTDSDLQKGAKEDGDEDYKTDED